MYPKKPRRKRRRKYSLAEKKAYAARLKKRMTPAETALWRKLRRVKAHDFYTQEVVGGYIPDFVEFNALLIVEVDGEIHKYKKGYDRMRTRHLNKLGYRVLRYQNSMVLNKTDSVCHEILVEAQVRKEWALNSTDTGGQRHKRRQR